MFAGLKEVFRRDQPGVSAETPQNATAGFGDFGAPERFFDGARYFSAGARPWRAIT